VFALVAVYFINLFFFQNYVIPSSSLEKSLLTGDYLFVSKVSYGPRIPETPLTMPLTQHTLPLFECKSYMEWPHWDYRRVKGLGQIQLNDIVVFNYPAGDTICSAPQYQAYDFYQMCYQIGYQMYPQRPDPDSLLGIARPQGQVCRTRLLWRRCPLKPALQTQTESAIMSINHKKVLARLCYATSVALATGWRGQKGKDRRNGLFHSSARRGGRRRRGAQGNEEEQRESIRDQASVAH
jgi:hypothetical protein